MSKPSDSMRLRLAVALAAFALPLVGGANVPAADDCEDAPLIDDRGPDVDKELETIKAKVKGELRDDAPPGEGEADPAAADDEAVDEETDAQAWKNIAATMKMRGVLKDGVFTVTVPRDDLDVTLEGNAVPAGAGLESQFRFYRCPCGKMNVIGQFCVADYEANDVVDALREGHMVVASVGPLLLYERPRLMLVRFQGEAKRSETLAKTLKSALSWTGEERMAPQKLEEPADGPAAE